MIVSIEATFECDECGKKFYVQIDPASSQCADWQVMEIAEDAIRGGQCYRDERKDEFPGIASVTDDKRHLCARCTRAMDDEMIVRPDEMNTGERQ